MVHQVLQRFRFQFSSPQSTPLPTSHSLSPPPSDEFVEPSGPYPELVGCLMYLMTCTRPDLAYPLSILSRYVAPGRHRKEHMDATKRVLRYLCNTLSMGLVLGGRGPVVQVCGDFVIHPELALLSLDWSCDLVFSPTLPMGSFSFIFLTLADLPADRLGGAASFSSSSQRGQLCLAYVASRANTADVFTKALGSGDHQRFYTALGLVPTLPHLLVA
ncbi:unnamed protein product [Closterium sp. NIES-54]